MRNEDDSVRGSARLAPRGHRSVARSSGGQRVAVFAGHGTSHPDDVSLCTYDGTVATPGVKLSEVLAMVGRSAVREVVIVLDCCFSGAAGGVPQLGAEGSFLTPGLAILTASRDDQTAAETPSSRGAFSTFLGGALDGGAADVLGKVTIAGLYAYLDECFGAWDQRPVFKANLDRLSELRRCLPSVPHEVLRELPAWFSSADFEYPLDPSYEPDAQPAHAAHEKVFNGLQQCRSAKLVEPVGEDHLYYAAMNSTSCRLSPPRPAVSTNGPRPKIVTEALSDAPATNPSLHPPSASSLTASTNSYLRLSNRSEA